ncbi:rCG59666 [Rattus norvegicus]|uniref:RCG59666 n=1 Tax=Rattus norvegicus TaxID=10116 RepID=A6HR60_RAT|nr:rCG59666 [Rattus norvegicus]
MKSQWRLRPLTVPLLHHITWTTS